MPTNEELAKDFGDLTHNHFYHPSTVVCVIVPLVRYIGPGERQYLCRLVRRQQDNLHPSCHSCLALRPPKFKQKAQQDIGVTMPVRVVAMDELEWVKCAEGKEKTSLG